MVKSILMEKPRPEILNFLGFAPESLASQVQQFLKQLPSPTGEESKEETKEEEKPQETPAKTSEESSNNENESKQKEDVANLFGSTTTNDEFSVGAAQPTTPAQPAPKPQPVKNPITFPTEGVELEISRCLSVGNFELAVEICLKTNKLVNSKLKKQNKTKSQIEWFWLIFRLKHLLLQHMEEDLFGKKLKENFLQDQNQLSF